MVKGCRGNVSLMRPEAFARHSLESVTTSDQRETCGEFSGRGTGFRDTMPMDERRGCFNTHQGYKRNQLQMSAVQPRVLR